MEQSGISRRKFLKGGGATLAALTVPRAIGSAYASRTGSLAKPTALTAPNPHALGGAVVAQLPIPLPLVGRRRYIGSPSIAISENGVYLVTHDVFVPGGDPDYGIGTRVFYSSDGGRNWVHAATVKDLAYATVFTIGRNTYLLGTDRRARFVVRKSPDGGKTWGSTHAIGDAPSGVTPNTPAVYDGRIWFAYGGRGAMSAPLDRSVLDPAAWTFTNRVDGPQRWYPGFPENAHWTESQIVASPQTGVVVLPKTNGRAFTALIRVSDPRTATFSPDEGLICLAGTEKKFACIFDDRSQTFYALTNPALPVHSRDGKPEFVRNTAALLASQDLRSWSVVGVFLYSPDVDHEAFQYLACAIDGDDLAVVARTALQVGPFRPSRGHNSNLLTFHVIEDFRNFQREQVLVADTNNNRVIRFEANLTSRLAPLGSFTSARLTKPMGVVQGPTGDIFVCEQVPGGRVLRFAAHGGLIGVCATGGTDFTGTPESLAVGAGGELFMTVAFGSRSNKVYKIDPVTGRVTLLVPSTFRSAAGSGTLKQPRGLTIGPRGHLFVADRANDRIREFDPDTGEFLGNLTEDQRRPQALAWDPARGRLLFSRRTTDSDHDIARVLPSGQVLTLYTEADIGMALGIQSLRGRVYWTDYDKNRIYAIASEVNKRKVTSVSTGLNHPGNMARIVLRPMGELTRSCVRSHTSD